MSDIINDIEQTYKLMIRAWNEKLLSNGKRKKPMSYQKFRVLKTVSLGVNLSPDIVEASQLDRTTAARFLRELYDEELLERSRVDFRSYSWKVSRKGKKRISDIEEMLLGMRDDLWLILKENASSWL